MSSKKIYAELMKPFFDKTVAIILLILSLPILFFTSLVLAFQFKGKVFFFHKRTGMNEALFMLIKLKTMKDPKEGEASEVESRITGFGSLLRKLSIDELPQLFNVLKGEMSLVGPRPLLPEYLPFYSVEERLRYKVKPGITGWAQVHGRNASNWDERMNNDQYYARNFSFWLDCRILLLTVVQFFRFSQADFNALNKMTFIEHVKRK